MIGYGWGNVCYIVNLPPGEYLLYSKVSGGKVYYIANIPRGEVCYAEGLLYDTGFTYRFDRLKPRVSTFRGHPTNVYYIFNTVIGLSHLCCHNILYLLNNSSVICPTKLHSISEYYRILNIPHHPRL